MRRFVLLTYIGLTLAGFAGCHHCQKRRLAQACYAGCDPCGCAGSIAGPLATVPGPTSVVIPAPPDGIPGPPGGSIPGPPGR